MTMVNSPDRFDLTDRLPKLGSIEASTPMMLEIVAVGAIATQLPLRGQQLERILRQDAAVPQ